MQTGDKDDFRVIIDNNTPNQKQGTTLEQSETRVLVQTEIFLLSATTTMQGQQHSGYIQYIKCHVHCILLNTCNNKTVH